MVPCVIAPMTDGRTIPTVVTMTVNITNIAPASAGEAGYAEAIAAYNLHPQPSPAKTVIARSVEDVVAALDLARAEGLKVSVIGTGHSIATSQQLDRALLVRTDIDGPIVVDVDAETAMIPAGARWADVATAAAEHGFACLHGSSGTVGAVGYLLRGGISFYGREHGIAANSIESITIVLADGTVTTVSVENDPDLFWAIRGGGGGFGIVISVTIRLLPMWRILTGITIWDAEHARDLLATWVAWAQIAPRPIASSFRILRVPPMPGIPEQIAGRLVVAVDGAVTVRDPYLLALRTPHMHDLLDPLRAIADPIIDDWDVRNPADLPLTHMDPPEPLPYVGDHFLVKDLDSGDLQRIVDAVGAGSESALTSVELRQLGGAFATPSVTGGVFDRTGADFAVLAVGAIGGPLTAEDHDRSAARLRAALAHRDTGFTLPTFVESTSQPSRTFDRQTWAAVDAIRRRVDPSRLFAPAVVPFVES